MGTPFVVPWTGEISPLCHRYLRASPPGPAVCTMGAGHAVLTFQSRLAEAVIGPERFWGELLLRCLAKGWARALPLRVEQRNIQLFQSITSATCLSGGRLGGSVNSPQALSKAVLSRGNSRLLKVERGQCHAAE